MERLWRTVKYEEVCLNAYASASEARMELGAYFRFYNDGGGGMDGTEAGSWQD